MISIDDFNKVDIRVGKIIKVDDFPQVRQPSYKLEIDFGDEIGVKKSCGQFVANYKKEELIGQLVTGAVNLPACQIGPAVSEVLTLGFPDEAGNAVLISPTKEIPLGGKLF